MALVAVEIPKVGLVMENARLVRWLKNVGDLVKEGEPLLELETEKSVVEIESTQSGRLVEILLQADQEAQVGDRIAWLESDEHGSAAPRARPERAIRAPPGFATTSTPSLPSAAAGATGRIRSSPLARRVATEHAVDLRRVTGTGPRGRVQLMDVRRAIEAQSARTDGTAPDTGVETQTGTGAQTVTGAQIGTGPQARTGSGAQIGTRPQARTGSGAQIGAGPQARTGTGAGAQIGAGPQARTASGAQASTGGPSPAQPLSNMRRALARSMTLSNATIPQFTLERAVDWSALHAQRAKLCTGIPSGTVKPSVNDFLLQAIARALLSFPALNATFSGDPDSPEARIVPANGAHIGLVVAVENGLLVPVFHRIEQVGLIELARMRSDTVERALHGTLKREELEGATFSLSNLGARGPDRFNAIINPPQSAILAVGRQRDCVVIVDGEIQPRPLSQLTLTVDHRVADGRLASEFLAYLVELLEGDLWRSK
ncbi:MAG: dihydrolipoamide acetyltransferase family protein [Steroidobacteraceae bacterium]